MSSNLSNELSPLRTTVLTAKDDIDLIRNIYEPNALATRSSVNPSSALVLLNSNHHHTQPENINHLLTCSLQQPNSNSQLLTCTLLLTLNTNHQLLTCNQQQLNNKLVVCNHHQPNNMQPQANRNNLVFHNSNTFELANIHPCHLRQCESLAWITPTMPMSLVVLLLFYVYLLKVQPILRRSMANVALTKQVLNGRSGLVDCATTITLVTPKQQWSVEVVHV